MLDKVVILVGYSGHGLVVADTAIEAGMNLKGYIDTSIKSYNPFNLHYMGFEYHLSEKFWKNANDFILGIGDNTLRGKTASFLTSKGKSILNVLQSESSLSKTVKLGSGNFISRNVAVNAFVEIGDNCILNTGSVVEHGSIIGDNVHVAPGAILAGNVVIGNNTFIGANAVVKQGVRIGSNVVIGAGTVVLKDIKSNKTVIGNPGRELWKRV